MVHKKGSIVVRDLLVLTGLLSILFFSFLGNRPLAAPDEGRYVEIPREMVETGDYVTPHLNGLVYFEKPPLFYWIETLPIRWFGIQEAPLRFPLAFLALFGCLLTYFFVQRLYDRATGLWATGVLGCAFLYNVLGRLITLDMGFSVFLGGALLAFLTATEESSPKKRRGWMAFSSFCCAAAVLTKGLAGLALPGLIVLLWTLLTRRWYLLRFLFLPSSIFLFLLIILPWHLLVALKNPGFFNFYFLHEHFTRYLTTVHRRFQPFWFFIPVIFIGFLPWVSFLFRSVSSVFPRSRKQCQENPKDLFFLLWVFVPFLFFSISHSKLIPYILPIFPALAVLTAHFIQKHLRNRHSLRGEILGYSFLCLAMIAGITFFLTKVNPEFQELFRSFLFPLYGILGISSVGIPLLRLWKGDRIAIYSIGTSGVALLMLLIQMGPHIPRLSIKPLAQKFLTIMPKETQVFSYIAYYQDLPPYLNRTIQVVNWYGELLFGTEADPLQKQVISYQEFERAWKQAPWACVFCRQDRYQELIKHSWFTPLLLGTHDGQVLACNQVPEKR